MSELRETAITLLDHARTIYRLAPSHVPPGQMPPEGTYCVITALAQARETLRVDALYVQTDVFEAENHVYAALYALTGDDTLSEVNARLTTDEVLVLLDRALATL